jgi:hypothetical protein
MVKVRAEVRVKVISRVSIKVVRLRFGIRIRIKVRYSVSCREKEESR